MTAPRLELMVTADCPHAADAEALVREVAGRIAPEAEIARTVVADAAEAVRRGFPGSPTIRVDGEDIEGADPGPPALACRRYEGGLGVPPRWLVEARLLRALAPRHLLFLCVANSARSQMAEGLARALAPAGVRVSSAGSEPSRVNPFAVRALAEIGIDASAHRSKGTDDVAAEAERGEAPAVDAVVTLCAEEVCPVWLHRAARAHWPHPDPAAAAGTDGEILASFRAVRDELRRKLESLLEPAAPPTARRGDRADPGAGDVDMTTRVELKVDGMSCGHCVARVKKALEAVDGVRVADVTLEPGRAVVEGEDLDPDALCAAVAESGYAAHPMA